MATPDYAICAVARSDQAKALGVKMGEPLHLIRDKVEAHGIRVFSSNYTLYVVTWNSSFMLPLPPCLRAGHLPPIRLR